MVVKKLRKRYLFFIIFLFCIFSNNVYANKYIDGDLVPDNYIINPLWEEYNDLSIEEKKQYEVIPSKYLMVYSNENNYFDIRGKKSFSFEKQSSVGELPSSFDLRDVNGVNYVSPIKLQKSLGLCWDFASIASLESNMLIRHSDSSYYQDLDNDGVFEDSSHVITFSERQIDYATSYGENNKQNYYSYLSTRALGEGGNFINFVGAALTGISPIYDNVWGPYTTDYDQRDISEIFDVNNTEYFVKETVTFPVFKASSTQEYKDEVIKMIKRHVMSYGAVEMNTFLPITNCYDSEYDMVVFDGVCQNKSNVLEGHAMAIIGWDDNYGPNGDGAWIMKNSWSNPYDYIYVSYVYDYANVDWNYEYNGIKEIESKDWDNNYNATKKYQYNKLIDNDINTYEIKYYKSKNNSELLKYINFITRGQDTSYDVYISSTGDKSDYELVTNVTKELPGLLTVDIDDVELNSDAFMIKIVSNGSVINENYYINAFTSDKVDSSDVNIDLTYNLDDKYLSSINDISLYAYTENIPTGEYLRLISVYNSNNEDVSSLFVLNNMLVINGYSYGSINAADLINDDIYTFRIGYDNSFYEFSIELSMIEGIGLSGIGTKEKPYVISTVEDLIKISSKDYYLGASYLLNNDIDLSICKVEGSICYNNGRGWSPIGINTSNFTGTFDG